ncbi:MAG: DUF2062 domain-containing protein [Pseudomonadota bacterium]
MVFKRRNPLTLLERLRGWIYPRGGWRRGFEYLGHRVRRLPDTPHRVALGLACGAFVSFSPLFGLHFFYAMLCAWLLGGNIVASLIGTFIGNPLTFPVIAWISLGLGRWMLGLGGDESEFAAIAGAFAEAANGAWATAKSWFGYGPSAWDRLVVFLREVFLPYFIGGLAPGALAAALVYYLTRPLVAAYQRRRRTKLMERAKRAVARRMRGRRAPPDGAQPDQRG